MKLGNATSTFSSALWTTRLTLYSAGQLGTANRISQPEEFGLNETCYPEVGVQVIIRTATWELN